MADIKNSVFSILQEEHKAGRTPVLIENLYLRLVARGEIEYSREAEIYPNHPFRIQIADAIKALHDEGALKFMELPWVKLHSS